MPPHRALRAERAAHTEQLAIARASLAGLRNSLASRDRDAARKVRAGQPWAATRS